MNSFSELFDSQLVLGIGAIVVALLLLRLLLQVFQVGFGSMVSILVILLVLYFVFDISPRQVWYEVSRLPQELAQWARSIT